jgi:tRNA pseudouridine13 synthase
MLTELNYAYGKPEASGHLKASPEDFAVDEILGFTLSGVGEHLFVQIEKTMLTTEEMATFIAKTLHLPFRAVSYAGLKDKYAITTQWFSLHLPGQADPNLEALNTNQSKVLQSMRHDKKLKIGALQGNRFTIRVSQFEGDKEALLDRVDRVKQTGIPNYFGTQRFGNQGGNLERARTLLFENKKVKSRHLRGLYLSAARSFLFNEIVSRRVQMQCWNKALSGDLMMLSGTNSVFAAEQVDEVLIERVASHDISPAAPLWGEGEERLTADAKVMQDDALEPWHDWLHALEAQRLRKSYRSMVLLPESFSFNDDVFTFGLPKGSFATVVLRELCHTPTVGAGS